MSFQDAFAYASQRRPIIFPNMGFQTQLVEFEKLLRLQNQLSSPNRVPAKDFKPAKHQQLQLKNQAPPQPDIDQQEDQFANTQVNFPSFGQDDLGRLAEQNKYQMQNAMGKYNQFNRTDYATGGTF